MFFFKTKSDLYLFLTCCLGTLSIIVSCFFRSMSFYLLSGTMLMIFVFFILFNNESLYLMLYFLSLSPIFKYNNSKTSLFGILILLYVARNISKISEIKALPSFLLLFVYSIIISSSTNMVTAFRVMMSILFGYLILCNKEYDLRKAAGYASLGVIVSSVLALFKDYIPSLNEMLLYAKYRIDGEISYRFSGLLVNPNYYTIYLGTAASVYLYFYCADRFKFRDLIVLTILLIFGIQSISVSFCVSFLIVILFMFVFLLKNLKKNFIKFTSLTLFLLIVAPLVLSFIIGTDTMEMYLFRADRVNTGGSATMGDITTGRSTLLTDYLSFLYCNPIKLLLGSGFSPELVKEQSSHNTYVEVFFLLGILGGVLFIINYFNLIKTYKPSAAVCYSGLLPFIFLLARYWGRHLMQDEIHIFCIILCILTLKDNCSCSQQTETSQESVLCQA